VANAVHDALGIRIDEIPITPEKVLRALEAKREGKPARVGPTKLPHYTFPRILQVEPPEEWGGRPMAEREPDSQVADGRRPAAGDGADRASDEPPRGGP
jgi:hypothetical protein